MSCPLFGFFERAPPRRSVAFTIKLSSDEEGAGVSATSVFNEHIIWRSSVNPLYVYLQRLLGVV